MASFQKDTWLAGMKEELECPVCLESVKPPVRQCMNGHVACCVCAKKLTECPLCSEPLLKNNPTFVNNLLKALPRPCAHEQQGCKELCMADSEHEKYCGFRPVLCRKTGCLEMVPVNKLCHHYEKTHQRFVTKDYKGSTAFKPFDPEKAECWNLPLFFDGHAFFLNLHKQSTEGCWKIHFEAHFINKPSLEHFLNIHMDNEGFVASSTLTAIQYQGESDSAVYGMVTKIVEKHGDLCMKISQDLLRRLITDENKLNVSFSFFKK